MSPTSALNARLRAANQAELFDRHPALPIVLLILLPLALQLPFWLLGLSTNPIWFYSSISTGAHLLPGTPYLDPNAGYTSQALGHLVARDWLHGTIPWWNPYTGIGVPLAGELQPGPFFLPFNLLLLFKEGILWQRLAMQIIAGLATYALLRELGLSRLAAWMGGALFAVNGVIAWTPGPVAVYCTSPFLPCLLWGIERARKPRQGAVSILVIGLSIAWSILAGFPEPAYISGLLALAWGVYRLVCAPARWMVAKRALAGFALGLLVASPLLIAFVDYLLQSDSFKIHKVGGLTLPWASLATTLMPYVYGPLNFSLTPNNELTAIWAAIGGYIGALVLVMALVALTRKSADRGLKLLLLAWVLLCWGRTFGVQPISAIINHLPLLGRANFFRFADASWILALIVLAAYGLDEFLGAAPRRRGPFAIVILLLLICVALAWPHRSFWGWSHGNALVMFAFLGAALTWALAGLAAVWLAWRISDRQKRRTVLACLLILDASVMFLGAQVSARRNNQWDDQAMQYLHEHQGLSRSYTLGPLAPNYGAYFQVASINHNILPVPKLWAQYVDRNLLPGSSKDGTTFLWPGWAGDGEDLAAKSSLNLAHYREVGVKYVLTNPGQSLLPPIIVDSADASLPMAPEKSEGVWVHRLLAWQQSAASYPAKSSAERLVFQSVAALLSQVLAGVKSQPSVPSAQIGPSVSHPGSPGAFVSEELILSPDQSAETVVSMPASLAQSAIEGVGVLLARSDVPADGELAVSVCAGQVCRSGLRPLSAPGESAFLEVHLDQPLAAPSGTPLRMTFTHHHGSGPLALSVAVGGDQQLHGPNGDLPGRRLHLTLAESTLARGLHKVYADSLMDIWEVSDPAPYFEVIQGGPCNLAAGQREDVTAVCSSPAKLRRRELYMPGWSVKNHGAPVQRVQQDGIFQVTALPAGSSSVYFHFSPPYIEIGWTASLAGLAGLLWQLFRIVRSRGGEIAVKGPE